VAFRAPVNTPHRFTRRNIIRFVWRNTPFQGICFEFFAATCSRQFAPLLVQDPDHVSSVVRDQSQAGHWDAQYPSPQPSQIKCGARVRGPFLGSASNGLDPFQFVYPAIGVVLWSSSNVVSTWSIFSSPSQSPSQSSWERYRESGKLSHHQVPALFWGDSSTARSASPPWSFPEMLRFVDGLDEFSHDSSADFWRDAFLRHSSTH